MNHIENRNDRFVQIKIQKEKIFFVAKVKKSIVFMMDFFTGKIRDLDSNFSHETPKVAAGGLANKGNFFFLNFVRDGFS